MSYTPLQNINYAKQKFEFSSPAFFKRERNEFFVAEVRQDIDSASEREFTFFTVELSIQISSVCIGTVL